MSVIGPRRRRVLVPIPHTSEMGAEVTPLDLLQRIQEILATAPDPMTAVVQIHGEVSTWRLLRPDGARATIPTQLEPE